MALRIFAPLTLLRLQRVHRRYFNVSSSSLKLVNFILSDIGEGIREVTVRDWFVKEGDKVAQFDNICIVESDKASVNITSRYDGVIKKLYYEVGDTAQVGRPLVEIDTQDDVKTTSVVEPKKYQEPSVDTYAASAIRSSNDIETTTYKKTLATPAVRRIASEMNISLKELKGSGKGGRVLKEDVLRYADGSFVEKKHKNLVNRIVQISGVKKAMAKTMTRSGSIPLFTYSEEVDMSQLVKLREELKPLASKKKVQITYMPFFIKAVSKCLEEFPELNASVDEGCDNIIYKSQHNIGVAMDTKSGLIVPNIKNVQDLKIFDIIQELNRLLATGKDGILSPKDLAEGTFTISNIGVIGGTVMRPLILPPEVAILAIGKITPKPIFNSGDQIVKAHIGYISWSADHRVIDGATMARFATAWKNYVENPYELVFEL